MNIIYMNKDNIYMNIIETEDIGWNCYSAVEDKNNLGASTEMYEGWEEYYFA